MGALFSGGFFLLVVVMIFCVCLNAVIMPFAIVSIATSLRGIWRELRRVNGDASPRAVPVTPAAAETTRVEASAQSLSHQLTR